MSAIENILLPPEDDFGYCEDCGALLVGTTRTVCRACEYDAQFDQDE